MNAFRILSDFSRPLRRRHAFQMLILFVTSRCNSVCRTCFYWNSLNQQGDLTFDELVKISRTMPRFTDLWFSGGEPTLRADLTDVIDVFVEQNGVRSIKLPTNGLLTVRLEQIVDHVGRRHPQVCLHVNMALDGFRDTHDAIRGVPGNFDRALDSLRALTPRRAVYPGFYLFVNSVICRDNHHELIDLGHFIRNHVDVDGHYFQIIRGNALEADLLDVPSAALQRLYQQAVPLHRHYMERSRERAAHVPRALFNVFYMGTHLYAYETQFNNADHQARWSIPCKAGTTSAVLDFNGDLRICELRQPIGNIRDYDGDFARLWNDARRRQEVAQMYQDHCDCTHICFLYDSLRTSPRAQLWEIPRRYLAYKRHGEAFAWIESAAAPADQA